MEGLVNKILKSSREMNKKEKEIGDKKSDQPKRFNICVI